MSHLSIVQLQSLVSSASSLSELKVKLMIFPAVYLSCEGIDVIRGIGSRIGR